MNNKQKISIAIILLVAMISSFLIGRAVSPHRQSIICVPEESLQIQWTTDKKPIKEDPNFELNKSCYRLDLNLNADLFFKDGIIEKKIKRYGVVYLNKNDEIRLKWNIKLYEDGGFSYDRCK